MEKDFEKLSKIVSHALRHDPKFYDLILDKTGFVNISNLVASLRNQGWENLIEKDIIFMVENAKKKRHEIVGDTIRAYYGHTIIENVVRNNEKPPEVLFHGTIIKNLDSIKEYGLLPMQRNYVHLTEKYEDAKEVSERKKSISIILSIDAKSAFQNGINFYREQNGIWLTEMVPLKFIIQ